MRVQEQGAIYFAVQCRHRNKPIYVYSYLSYTMTRDPKSGIITHDQNGCIGCWPYVMVCPFGPVVARATMDPYVAKRINPEIAAERFENLLGAWSLEIKEMMGGMGINAIDSLKGNRPTLRAVGLTETELKVLGVSLAGD